MLSEGFADTSTATQVVGMPRNSGPHSRWTTTTGYQLLAIAPGALDARTPDEVYYFKPVAIHATTQIAESGAGRG